MCCFRPSPFPRSPSCERINGAYYYFRDTILSSLTLLPASYASCVDLWHFIFGLTWIATRDRADLRCIFGVLAYKAVFRMRYSSISPSSYTARGSFARVGIPAPPNFDYATPSQRARIERLGRAFGCHTCGSRMIVPDGPVGRSAASAPRFHADHIPPVSVARQLNDRWYRRWLGLRVTQRFYPQCRNCSNRQGGLLSRAVNAGHGNLRAAGGGAESHFHGRRPRIGHLTGGAVAVLSVGGIGDGDAADSARSSRERVRSMQDWIEDAGAKAKERILNAWRDSC